MLVSGLSAAVFATNCYVLAAAAGGSCVVVDPGVGVADRLGELLAEHGLTPEAVLLTHGHFDHTYSAAALCGAWGVPAYIHPADREQLGDPARGVSMDLRELFGEGFSWREPEEVIGYPESVPLRLAGLDLIVDHAPGHTQGSVLLRVEGGEAGVRESGVREGGLCLSGDVLFEGSVGRTDLAGGDPTAMAASLRDKILSLADTTVVLPGHGPRTTIGRERAGNPWLRQVHPDRTPGQPTRTIG